MGELFIIGIGGFVGAILRYLVSGYAQNFPGSEFFPYGTLLVNVLGSFAIGLFFFFIETRGAMDPQARTFILIGILGAFTTFSTFSMESINLIVGGEIQRAFINVLANCTLGLSAAWFGRVLPSLF